MVTLINCFEVPIGQEDEFLGLWHEVNAYMRTKPGYLGHKLHRTLAPDSKFHFVNVAQWSSLSNFQSAHDAGFRALVNQSNWVPFRSQPALYEVVHEGEVGTAFWRRPQSFPGGAS